jgi:phospholipid/cholesterol/gamma-HCH transport system substrate-binding protein
MMTKKGIETLVGLFVLLGLAGLVFLSLKAANLGSFGARDGYTVTARFDNIGGLKPRSPVRSAGVTVGRVNSITLDSKTFQGLAPGDVIKQTQSAVVLENLIGQFLFSKAAEGGSPSAAASSAGAKK